MKQIARVMECSEGTVKSRLNYGRKAHQGPGSGAGEEGNQALLRTPLSHSCTGCCASRRCLQWCRRQLAGRLWRAGMAAAGEGWGPEQLLGQLPGAERVSGGSAVFRSGRAMGAAEAGKAASGALGRAGAGESSCCGSWKKPGLRRLGKAVSVKVGSGGSGGLHRGWRSRGLAQESISITARRQQTTSRMEEEPGSGRKREAKKHLKKPS